MLNSRLVPRMKVALRTVTTIDKDLDQKLILANGNSFQADAFDIGPLGIGIRIKYFLPKGLIVELKIKGTPFGLRKPMKLQGIVRYCKNVYIQHNLYKCGIKFITMPKEYKKAILQFCSTYEKRKKIRLRSAK